MIRKFIVRRLEHFTHNDERITYFALFTACSVMYNAGDMDDELLVDLQEQFAFGDELNDCDIVFSEYAAAPKTLSAKWQRIVEMKSAAHEGYLTYFILAEREQEGLPVYAKSLFSVHSPIEQLSAQTNFFTGSITSRKHYGQHREDVLVRLAELIILSPLGSPVSDHLHQVKELLMMQLYGFGRAALQDGDLNQALEAFRIASILHKEKVISYVRDFVAGDTKAQETVKEYIHVHQ